MLRYLDEIVRSGSIRQAAEKLNVASSAINRQILDLERQLGTPLFQRMPRGLRLTASGEVLISHVRETLKGYDRTRERMLDLEGLRAGAVTIAAMHGPADGLIPAVGVEFRRKYPRITIAVRIAHVGEIVRLVEEGEVDIGLVYNLPRQHGLHTIQSFATRLGAVVSATHPLASAASVRLSACADYPIVMADPSLTINRIMRSSFRRANVTITPAFETNSTAIMKSVVRDGLHVTFLSRPDVGCSGDADPLVYLPIVGAGVPEQPLALVHRANTSLGLAASLLAEQLRDALERMISVAEPT